MAVDLTGILNELGITLKIRLYNIWYVILMFSVQI